MIFQLTQLSHITLFHQGAAAYRQPAMARLPRGFFVSDESEADDFLTDAFV